MIFEEINFNLFDITGDDVHYVQCISADLGMGKGIAVEFNIKFDMRNSLQSIYSKNKPDVGKCIHVRYIPVFNLVTKSKYYEKPTYDDLKSSLIDLRKNCDKLNITKLVMPRIGCGLDKLDWNIVRNMIKEVFNDSNIHITVCYL